MEVCVLSIKLSHKSHVNTCQTFNATPPPAAQHRPLVVVGGTAGGGALVKSAAGICLLHTRGRNTGELPVVCH
ncbi:hypothetical protein NQZ68_036128 [Dissostichus eleginoides]|nr:hypothetical protein NQZ68_036128 [Dissostichus eleginoides]